MHPLDDIISMATSHHRALAIIVISRTVSLDFVVESCNQFPALPLVSPFS